MISRGPPAGRRCVRAARAHDSGARVVFDSVTRARGGQSAGRAIGHRWNRAQGAGAVEAVRRGTDLSRRLTFQLTPTAGRPLVGATYSALPGERSIPTPGKGEGTP